MKKLFLILLLVHYIYCEIDYAMIEKVNREAAERSGQPLTVVQRVCGNKKMMNERTIQQKINRKTNPLHEKIIKSFDGSFDNLSKLFDDNSLISITTGVERLDFVGILEFFNFWNMRWKSEVNIDSLEYLSWEGSNPEKREYRTQVKLVVRSLFKSISQVFHATIVLKLSNQRIPVILNFNFDITEKNEFEELTNSPCHFIKELGYYVNQKNADEFITEYSHSNLIISLSKNFNDISEFSQFPSQIEDRIAIVSFLNDLNLLDFPENLICMQRAQVISYCKIKKNEKEDSLMMEWSLKDDKIEKIRFILGGKPSNFKIF